MQNLASPMQLGFPISNYTMSLSLLERIEFWDTNEDAIGEDFHMFVKAYFKTEGQVTHCYQHAVYEKCGCLSKALKLVQQVCHDRWLGCMKAV